MRSSTLIFISSVVNADVCLEISEVICTGRRPCRRTSRFKSSVQGLTEQSVPLDFFRLCPAYVQQTEDLAKAREALVTAETSRQHLQDRVNDLLKQIKADEKIPVYEHKT